jgi:hypothetical protein
MTVTLECFAIDDRAGNIRHHGGYLMALKCSNVFLKEAGHVQGKIDYVSLEYSLSIPCHSGLLVE